MIKALCLILSVATVYAQLKDCDVGGELHKSGESFMAPDGCNRCFCTNGAAACTLKFCLPVSKTCNYNNQIYQTGDSFPAMDGCNTCSCSGGMASCTEMFCLPSTDLPPP